MWKISLILLIAFTPARGQSVSCGAEVDATLRKLVSASGIVMAMTHAPNSPPLMVTLMQPSTYKGAVRQDVQNCLDHLKGSHRPGCNLFPTLSNDIHFVTPQSAGECPTEVFISSEIYDEISVEDLTSTKSKHPSQKRLSSTSVATTAVYIQGYRDGCLSSLPLAIAYSLNK